MVKQEKDLRQRRDRTSGKQLPIIERIDGLTKELETEKLKKANANYRKKKIEMLGQGAICEDLNKYYVALDHSIMTYHKKKMVEINKLLYRFWKQSYQGGDIDHIKIESDQDEHRADSSKRNYNYRVVMVRDTVDIDMRGRCSAGQKVLASLIIRLALAEIFCSNCGILALDEPTTNLDRGNIRAFAQTIAELVKYHTIQRNMQIILITHDEMFLEFLGDLNVEHYFRVFKDENGFSRIKRCEMRAGQPTDIPSETLPEAPKEGNLKRKRNDSASDGVEEEEPRKKEDKPSNVELTFDDMK